MKKAIFFPLLLSTLLLAYRPGSHLMGDDDLVTAVLAALGEPPPPHRPRDLPGASVEKGRRLVLGADPAGRGGQVSKHFLCTACHNVERDEPTLRFDDPQARLAYVAQRGLPFLPGSALYGVVNRTLYYNGDYEKKYGALVATARHDLRQAIQLCATECSQGRPLDEAEMESVLAYLWTIGLKMDDLGLTAAERRQVEAALAGTGDRDAAIRLIRSRYAAGAPATFVSPPDDRREGYVTDAPPDPGNGRLLYELSCLHCHEDRQFAFFRLDDSRFTHRYLEKHLPRYTRYSLYQVLRWGTSPVPGKPSYMPNYTREKMTDAMVEDLRAYIEARANGLEEPKN